MGQGGGCEGVKDGLLMEAGQRVGRVMRNVQRQLLSLGSIKTERREDISDKVYSVCS